MPTVKKMVLKLNGKPITVYPISVLASALGKSTLTVRRWERLGYIPDTFFINKRGHRMYSQEQIDIIVGSAKEAGVKQGNPIDKTNFAYLCCSRMEELREKYLNKENKNEQVTKE